MKALAVEHRTIRSRCGRATWAAFAVALAAAVWTAGTPSSLAETPTVLRVIENPTTTLRALIPAETTEPESEEIWVDSEKSTPDAKATPEANSPHAEPGTEEIWVDSEKSTPDPKATPEANSSHAEPGSEEIWVNSEKSTPDPKATPEANSPQAEPARGARANLRIPELSSIPKAPSFAAAILRIRTLKSPAEGEEPAEAAAKQADEPNRQHVAAVMTPVEEDASALFRTTSSPVKPAAMVFRSASSSAVAHKRPLSGPSRPTALEVPAAPTSEPDVQAPLTADAPALKARPSKHSAQRQPRPTSPLTQPAKVAVAPGVPQVMLRVKLAELDRSAGSHWSIPGLKFSAQPPLLGSLLRAETGPGAIVLDSLDVDEIESDLESLKQRGAVRVRSEPTVVTASGRAARLVLGGGTQSAAGSGERASAEAAGFHAAVTLLPLVTSEGHIRLKVTSELSGPVSEKSADGAPASTTRADTTHVEMRAGQTLAIGGLRHDEEKEEEHARDLTSIARILGIRKKSPKRADLVILVTPELILTRESHKAAALARYDALSAGSKADGSRRDPSAVTSPKSGYSSSK